jgi:hypothetical protein
MTATYTEIVKLDQRIIELEARFAHYHVSNGIDDSCAFCRFDLRDPIHKRVKE